MSEFTQVLHSASAAKGNPQAAHTILPLVYQELRKLAYSHMASQSPSHTLQPTALVHEAWLRMVDDEDRTWNNRNHFFAAAATAMRNILIDHARKKSRQKRGGNPLRVDLEQFEIAIPEIDEFILKVDDALQRLEEVNPKWARIVVMKYFGGMTNKEIAATQKISESSVERYWAAAKAWLLDEINSQA